MCQARPRRRTLVVMALCSAPCWAWPDDDVWGWGNKFWRWRIALLDLSPPLSRYRLSGLAGRCVVSGLLTFLPIVMPCQPCAGTFFFPLKRVPALFSGYGPGSACVVQREPVRVGGWVCGRHELYSVIIILHCSGRWNNV